MIDRNIYPKIEIQGQQKQTHAGIGTTIDWLSLTIPSSLTWEPITIHLQREREVSKEPDDRSFNSLVLKALFISKRTSLSKDQKYKSTDEEERELQR